MVNTTHIRVAPEDVAKMRNEVKILLLKLFPELKNVTLSDRYLFEKTVEYALK